MATNIVVPELGESVIEATVSRWLKQPGEQVKAGEAVLVLETDKVDLEVAAEKSGVLGNIQRKEGEDVKVGDVLGTIDETGVETAPPPKQETKAAPSKEPVPVAQAEMQAAGNGAQERVTPVAKRLAEEQKIDLSQVKPSGGKITKEDVQRYIET